jgi:hypothetical protein
MDSLLLKYVYSSVFCKDHQCLAFLLGSSAGKSGSSLGTLVRAPLHVGLEANNKKKLKKHKGHVHLLLVYLNSMGSY